MTPGPPARTRTRRWMLVVGVGVLVMLLVRGLVVQSFSVTSTSMQPTLEPGDRILVSRLHRGPSVHRGDLVVFGGTALGAGDGGSSSGSVGQVVASMASLFALDTGTDYVKRVIGTPGDRVTCCGDSGRLHVNGIPIDEAYAYPGEPASAIRFDVVVPRGRIWVMGDHRSESGDSRARLGDPGGGMVPLDDVIGRVWVRYWPFGRLGALPGAAALSFVPSQSGAGP